MDSEIYRKFAEYLLADLATRNSQVGKRLLPGQRRYETVAGQKQRVPLTGHHIAYTGRVLFRGDDGVLRERFRGHDGVLRESLACIAFEKYHRATKGKERGAAWNACLMVAKYESLHGAISRGRRGPKPKAKPVADEPPAQVLRFKPPVTELRDPRFDELDVEIAEQDRKRRAPKLQADLIRAARTIKKKTDAFRERNGDAYLSQIFCAWLGAFRSQFCRDAEWCVEQEPVYKARVEAAKDYLNPAEGRDRPEPPPGISVERWEQLKRGRFATQKRDVAMAVVNLAGIYHEQGKFQEAAAQYQLAMGIYESTSISLQWHDRELVLSWIKAQIDNCSVSRQADSPWNLRRWEAGRRGSTIPSCFR